MAICKHCGQEYSGFFLNHVRTVHREEADDILKPWHKRRNSNSDVLVLKDHKLDKEKEVKPASTKATFQEGGKLATIVEPKPASVVFTLGALRIEIDPKDLYDCYTVYQDIRSKCGLTDPFSAVLKDAMFISWRLMVLKPRIVELETATVEVGHNGSDGG